MVVGEDKNHAMLVDFDWTGRHRQDMYPSCVGAITNDLESDELHEDVGPWEHLKKTHDTWALHKLINRYQKPSTEGRL